MHQPETNTPDKRTSKLTHGPAAALLFDAGAWVVGVTVAAWTRYEFDLTRERLASAITLALVAISLQAFIGHTQYLYRGRHGFGTFDEVGAVTATVVGSAALLLAFDMALPDRLVPASSPIVGGTIALVLMLGRRYLSRLGRERRLRPNRQVASPVLLFGAGAAGHDLTRAMLRDPKSAYVPVGLLDDDPDKCHLRVHGVPVLGGRHNIPAALAKTDARTVIFSVANANGELIRAVQRISVGAGAAFKVVPSVGELLDGRACLADVRDVQVSDLLGRHQIETDLAPIAGYLTGKRVLVTGAGGSIGSELCRQIRLFHPGELIMLDRDESALHAVQLSLRGRALLDSAELVLADLRDAEAIREVFATRAPQVVFHAAALKHLPLLERYPGEAVKTNVWGTQTTLEAARDVEKFVNISTDKAANPTSVLGYSKRITERLTAHASMRAAGTFLNVRFGNVLGSRGSVLTAFQAQAAAGGPITVTDPDVTRYFMTVQEAVSLVIQAAAIGGDGEALVLDMGDPVRIADVAAQLAEQAPHPVQIVYTGLRPGEKLHEELFADGEQDQRPLHPLISHVEVPPLHPDRVRLIDPSVSKTELIAELDGLCRAEITPSPAAPTPAAPTPAPAANSAAATEAAIEAAIETTIDGAIETTIEGTIEISPAAGVVGRQFTGS
jgi:FlaA1/EpsC-like NDP-sugar epimerase